MATVSRSKQRAYRRVLDGAILAALAGRPLNVKELAEALAAAGLTWKRSANLYRTLARLVAEGVIVKQSRQGQGVATFTRCGPTQAPPVAVEPLVLRVLRRAGKPLSDQQVAWRCDVYQPTTRTAAAAALGRLAAEGRVVARDDKTYTAANSRREEGGHDASGRDDLLRPVRATAGRGRASGRG